MTLTRGFPPSLAYVLDDPAFDLAAHPYGPLLAANAQAHADGEWTREEQEEFARSEDDAIARLLRGEQLGCLRHNAGEECAEPIGSDNPQAYLAFHWWRRDIDRNPALAARVVELVPVDWGE